MTDLPTGTVSFVFTDIEGSTRLLQRLGRDRYAVVLERHNALMRELAGDSVVSTEGDSFFCVFASAPAAVRFAADAQRRLHSEEWGADVELRVRMGVHTGEGVLGGDYYVGIDVHRAARIAAAAHGGQILFSAATLALIRQDLPPAVTTKHLGRFHLKDLAEPEQLHQIVIDGLPRDFPPPRSLDDITSRLPEFLTRFVGRDEELQTVLSAFDDSRLVALTGMGGSGKTRLAVEAGRRLQPSHPDGVFFISFEDATESASLAKAVSRELGVTEQVGRAIEDTLTEYLAPRTSLLILDSCERVAPDAASLAQRLLLGCPRLRILVTSREPLQVSGETVLRIGPMRLGDADIEDLEDALNADAVRLFVTRALAVNPALDIESWARSCVEICRRLEGIPLAIELAAARVAVLTPGDIIARLDDRFALLTTRASRGADRHQTLETAIQWSYDILSDETSRLLRGLSVFRGGFTIEAVAAVCFDVEVDDMWVLDELTELSEKSFLTRQLDAPGVRFRQLETIREFALARLHRSGEYEEANRRHRRYFTALAREQAHLLGGDGQLDALERLEADHDNLSAVIVRSVASGENDEAAAMAGWLSWFWYVHSHFSEGEQWAAQLLDDLPPLPNRTWLRLLVGAGQYDFRIGAFERAEQRLRLARQVSADQQIPRMAMWAGAYLATNDLYRMHLHDAIDVADRAVAEASDLGDALGFAYATYISVSARTALLVSESALDSDTAAGLIERLTPVSHAVRSTGERNMIGHVLQTEGMLAWLVADTKRASASFDAAITALTELGQVGCACHCLESIARFLIELEEVTDAARLIGAVDSLRDQIGISIAPVERLTRSEATALAIEELGEPAYEAEVQRGSMLSLQEASQLARQVLATAQPAPSNPV